MKNTLIIRERICLTTIYKNMITTIHIIASIFFASLATFCWIVESSYLRKYEKCEDSFEKYESYRKSLNYNFLKIFWYVVSIMNLIIYLIGEIMLM